jgi:RNA polymerase sigma-70 factor, ECF subfamily
MMAAPNSDMLLLEAFRNDNRDGFKGIVLQFQERLYWQIRRYTKNHQDTEDVLQLVFIKAWKGLPNFREEANLYTWLYRIAYNETHTFLTRESKRQMTDLDPPLFENKLAIEGKEYGPEEIEEILMRTLETLPEKQLLVFNLKYFDDLKFTEIAELTGTSVGALKASYHLAVKKIEEFLKQV